MSDMLGQLTNGLKRLASIKKDMDELQFKEIILEQRGLLLDAKEEILELREEYSNLRQELKDQSDAANRKKSLIEVLGFKYDSDGERPIGLPYCPACEVREGGKLYRLNRTNNYYSKCPNCNTGYQVGKDGGVHVEQPLPTRTVTGLF